MPQKRTKKINLSQDEKNLMRRYLIWCYKTAKEALDRVDRYFTQLIVDEQVIGILLKTKDVKDKEKGREYLKKIDEFAEHMEKKEARVLPQKYLDPEKEILQPEYWYLKNRLAAIEKTIVRFFGLKELKAIKNMYEEEMTRRILEARDHS